MANGIEIFVGNYGSYNAGYLVDKSIALPVSSAELERFLADVRAEAEKATGQICEEMYISDYADGVPFNETSIFNEYTDIEMLNCFAALLEDENLALDDELIQAGFDYKEPKTIIEVCNLVMQKDEIPFYGYDWASYTGNDPIARALSDSTNNLVKLGETVLNGNLRLKEVLENDPVAEAAFDLEEYGRQYETMGLDAYDTGYLDRNYDSGLDLNYFSREEIIERAKEILPDRVDIAGKHRGIDMLSCYPQLVDNNLSVRTEGMWSYIDLPKIDAVGTTILEDDGWSIKAPTADVETNDIVGPKVWFAPDSEVILVHPTHPEKVVSADALVDSVNAVVLEQLKTSQHSSSIEAIAVAERAAAKLAAKTAQDRVAAAPQQGKSAR